MPTLLFFIHASTSNEIIFSRESGLPQMQETISIRLLTTSRPVPVLHREDTCGCGVRRSLAVFCWPFPVPIEDEQELVPPEGAVAVGKAEPTVELRVVAESLTDAGHADEDDPQLGSVVLVAEEFQCGRGEAFGFVDDEQFDQLDDAVRDARCAPNATMSRPAPC
jgi:hypothetical protein